MTGGSTTDRFTLTSVVLDHGTCSVGASRVVQIANDGTNPGTQVGSNLTNSSGSTWVPASGETITLNGATSYFVVLRTSGGSFTAGCVIRMETNNTETGTSGWSIADESRRYASNDNTWNDSNNFSKRLRINATTATAADTTPPTVRDADVFHDELHVKFNERLDRNSLPPMSAFTVTGLTGGVRLTGTPFFERGISSKRLTLPLSGPVPGPDRPRDQWRAIKVTYTQPVDTARRLQDAAGNHVASFSNVAVHNNNKTVCQTTGSGAPPAPAGLSVGSDPFKDVLYADFSCPDRATKFQYKVAGIRDSWTDTTNYRVHRVYEGGRAVRKVALKITGVGDIGSGSYTISVRAGNDSGWSGGASGASESLPGPVSNIRVIHNGTSLKVTWDAAEGAADYDVTYYGNSVNARAAWDHTGTSLTISCDSRYEGESRNCVSGDHAYNVSVRAGNAAGHSDWRNSAYASYTPPPQSGQQPATPPDPVSNISVTHKGNNLSVSWDAPARATHYDVTYSGNGANARAAWNRAGTSLTITCDIRTGYENQNCVTGSAAYTVGIRARNAAGTSDWRNSASASLAVPDPVTGITVVHHGVFLAVEWTASPGATAYDVTYYGNNVNARGAWNRAGTSLFIRCDVRPDYVNQNCVDGGSSYTVGVRARNAAGASDWRNSASAAPPSLAVADATVEEAASATLDFVVTLTRALPGSVTVQYATSDGTATAGNDYTAKSGTLTFTRGQTSKTVSVAVLDDAHDEDDETLTLTLSNASGAPISDATATGTITNNDPLQRQWLSRFGRTVAGQMIEALEGRFATGAGAPSHLTIAGQRLDLAGAAPPRREPWQYRGEAGGTHGTDVETRSMDMRELLLGSSFHFTAGDVSGLGAMTGWGKALTGSSSASPGGGLTFTSQTVTGVLGMDWERGNLLVGLALSESVESGGASGPSEYDMEGSLSLVTPYARLKASDRLSFWTMTGTGQGSLSFAHGDARLDADIAMQMVAAGGRADLLKPDEGGGLALALKTDAFFVRTESESVSRHGVGNLAGATGDASRVRAVLEGSRSFALSGGGSVEPSLTLGLRHDGGDAETGTGVEVGAGLAWSDPSGGIASDLRLYSLAAHEDAGYEEWGVSGSLRIVPHASGRGMSLSMTPSWGAQGQGNRIWSTRPSALVDEGDGVERPGARFDTELGYGLFLSDHLTGTPYVGLGLGEARDYRLGWRLTSGRWQSFSLGVEAARREAANDDAPAGHEVMLNGSVRW